MANSSTEELQLTFYVPIYRHVLFKYLQFNLFILSENKCNFYSQFLTNNV